MAEWTTGAAILAHAGAAPGSDLDVAWSELCASAVNQGIDARLEGAIYIAPPLPAELVRAALSAGVQTFKSREANLDAQLPAVSGDAIASIEPILERYATTGIA
jgi:hypothetical protein